MRAKKVNEQENVIQNWEEKWDPVPIKTMLKEVLPVNDSDIYGDGCNLQVDFDGPDRSNIILDIEILGTYKYNWYAQDLDHEHHANFDGGSGECETLEQLETELSLIPDRVFNSFNEYEYSDEYNEGRHDD